MDEITYRFINCIIFGLLHAYFITIKHALHLIFFTLFALSLAYLIAGIEKREKGGEEER